MFSLSTDQLDQIREVFDDMITQFGKNCRLYYQPKAVACECQTDPIGQKPSNRWITGTPVGFHEVCGICNGGGKKFIEVTEDITMVIDQSPKLYEFFSKDLRLPDGLVLTQGFITDLPKIRMCTYAVLQTEIEAYNQYKYKLYGEPIDPHGIIKSRYFTAFWQRC